MALHIGHELFTHSGLPRYSNSYFHFTYPFFGWIHPLAESLVNPFLWVAMLSAIMISIGLFYRVSTALYFLVYTYLFLIDVSYYNNHYYLIALVSGVMVFLNLANAFSLDSLIFRSRGATPVWHRHFLAFHIILVYFFGGVSKLLNPQWITGDAMHEMLVSRLASLGLDLTSHALTTVAQVMTIGGTLFDLSIGIFLFWKRTFWLAVVGVVAFNLINAYTFNIGVFPFIMLGSLVLFYSFSAEKSTNSGVAPSIFVRGLIGAYAMVLILTPIRHLFISGDSFWTSEGYLFSWNMKPGTKSVDAIYLIRDQATGLKYTVDPHEYLTPPAYLALGKYPLVAPQFAHFLSRKASLWNIQNPEITAIIKVSRNRGPYYSVIDPNINLIDLSYHPLQRNAWIVEDPEAYDVK